MGFKEDKRYAGHMDQLLWVALPQIGEQVYLAGLFNGFFCIVDFSSSFLPQI